MGVVRAFDGEWTRFDQSALPEPEAEALFGQYFSIFPWEKLPPNPVGFDLGCGSGRWARRVAPRVGRLYCVDPSQGAIEVARRNLQDCGNCVFLNEHVGQLSIPEASCDFGYTLGVLHHVPDPVGGLRSCASLLKPGAPLLVYLYYRFENRPGWFRCLWRVADVVRRGMVRLPRGVRYWLTQGIALLFYFPLARTAWLAEKLGVRVDALPLSAYRHRSFYTMRTDALDRFGTPVEHRFTRPQITQMLEAAGLVEVRFMDGPPYWTALAFRRREPEE